MAKAKETKPTREHKENRIVRYLKEVRSELMKVTWPSRSETFTLTIVVLVTTVAMSGFLAVVDWGFSQLIRVILQITTGS